MEVQLIEGKELLGTVEPFEITHLLWGTERMPLKPEAVRKLQCKAYVESKNPNFHLPEYFAEAVITAEDKKNK